VKVNSKHLSGKLHVSGKSMFVENIAQQSKECLYAYPLVSSKAKAKIIKIDAEVTKSNPNFITLITYEDIPGENNIAHGNGDLQPVLAEKQVNYVGEPIAIVVASTREDAIKLSRKIKVEYEELTPIVTIKDAVKEQTEYAPSRLFSRVDDYDKSNLHELKGKQTIGAQEHFYFETQRCFTVNEENGCFTVYSSTQAVSEVQEVCARLLGLASNYITVDVRRLGGAFGGKEAQATLWAGITTIASYVCQKPVYLALERKDDISWTGKRHEFVNTYSIKYNDKGDLLNYSLDLKANGGAYIDLSYAILERALLHADSGYYIPEMNITGTAYRTNLPPNTAFRGFGAPQAILTTEMALEKVAYALNMDLLEIRKRNVYRRGQTTQFGMEVKEALGLEMLEDLEKVSNYHQLKKEISEFNQKHKFKKKGIGIVTGKFGISFTSTFLNQGSALIWIYTDGSISLSHGGIEMGQQLYTKVATVVCNVLGISMENIRSESTNTKRVGNSSPTAASSGSDLNGNAARQASENLKARLSEVSLKLFKEKYAIKAELADINFENNLVFSAKYPEKSITFKELAHYAYMNRVDLGEHSFYKTPEIHFNKITNKGAPFYYYVYGAALMLSEVDVLTGSYKFDSIYVVHDNGIPLNSEIDKGQIIGATVQGLGYCTMEEVKYNEKGESKANTPSTYKIPTMSDVCSNFVVKQVSKERSQASVLGSKAVGEPPFLYGLAGWFSIMNAISFLTNSPEKIELNMPATPEAVLLAIEDIKKRGLYV
jgi:xanthine dehydrogenase molybdopterin binding subunit